jgi:hypothetical protein
MQVAEKLDWNRLMFVIVVSLISLLVSSNCEHQYDTVCRWNMWWLQNVPGITLYQRNTKQFNHLSYISFKIVLLCNCSFFLATVKLLGTFLKAISWKPFHESLFSCSVAFLMMSLASQNCHPLKLWFQGRKQVKIGWSHIGLCWGLLLCCHIVLC